MKNIQSLLLGDAIEKLHDIKMRFLNDARHLFPWAYNQNVESTVSLKLADDEYLYTDENGNIQVGKLYTGSPDLVGGVKPQVAVKAVKYFEPTDKLFINAAKEADMVQPVGRPPKLEFNTWLDLIDYVTRNTKKAKESITTANRALIDKAATSKMLTAQNDTKAIRKTAAKEMSGTERGLYMTKSRSNGLSEYDRDPRKALDKYTIEDLGFLYYPHKGIESNINRLIKMAEQNGYKLDRKGAEELINYIGGFKQGGVLNYLNYVQ